MENWVKTGDGKKIKMLFGGKVTVISSEDTSNIVPLFCPCCELPMKDINDSISYKKISACSRCDDRWSNKPNVVWPEGPDKNSKEWDEYLKNRLLLEKTTIIFR